MKSSHQSDLMFFRYTGIALVLGTIMAGGILLSLTHIAGNPQFEVTATEPPQDSATKAVAVLAPSYPSPNGSYLLISDFSVGTIPPASH